MLARIIRLQGHGVGKLFCLKSLLDYSTTAEAAAASEKPDFLVDYLMHSLGFSRQEAFSTSRRVSLYDRIPKNPDPKYPNLVLDFFQEMGLSKTHIKKMIFTAPALLFCDADKTLKPKMQFLQENGLNNSEVVKVVKGNCSILLRGLETQIKPCVNYLRNLLKCDEKLVKAICRSSANLLHAAKTLESNVLVLRRNGFSSEEIEWFIFNTPRIFLRSPEVLQEIVSRVERDLGIGRDSARFMHGVQVLSSLRKSTMDMKFGIFRSFGWSDSDIITMAMNNPLCLMISEAKLQKILNVYMKKLFWKPDLLASRPILLTFSMEKRLIPRMHVLEILNEKKLNESNASLPNILCCSEEKFFNQFVLPYRDAMPEMYELYTKAVGR